MTISILSQSNKYRVLVSKICLLLNRRQGVNEIGEFFKIKLEIEKNLINNYLWTFCGAKC